MSVKGHRETCGSQKALVLASVASMIDQFNMPNIRLLQDMGYEVHILCNFREGNTCDEARIRAFQRELDLQGVRWIQWDCPRSLWSVNKCIRAYLQLWRLTGCNSYVMIHCHSPIGGAIARVVARNRGIRVIYTAHGFHFYHGAPVKNWLLYYPVEKLLAYWTDVLITINREDYAFAKRNLRANKIFRIPGVGVNVGQFFVAGCGAYSDRGISMEAADAKATKEKVMDAKAMNMKTAGSIGCGREEMRRMIRVRYGIPRNAVLLLSVGELNKGKNHRIVLEALAKLHDKNVYYLICGQGELRDWLVAHARKLGIEKQVRIPGYVADIAAAYAAADIFVFPSKREGMPVALIEAMAAGLPCVVSDIRGNRELTGECVTRDHIPACKRRKAYLANPQQFRLKCPGELQKKLQAMIACEELRDEFGKRNRRRSGKYDLALVRERMRLIYQDICVNGTAYQERKL